MTELQCIRQTKEQVTCTLCVPAVLHIAAHGACKWRGTRGRAQVISEQVDDRRKAMAFITRCTWLPDRTRLMLSWREGCSKTVTLKTDRPMEWKLEGSGNTLRERGYVLQHLSSALYCPRRGLVWVGFYKIERVHPSSKLRPWLSHEE
jgi:hypothetical protein